MRFDDTLETVMSGDLATPFGVQSAWRQLIDLIGRRRAPATAQALNTLRSLRGRVPLAVRAASARALEFANPPAALVRLFAVEDVAVALPVLRGARMESGEWIQLLPELAPPHRAVLRHRRDLSPVVRRALDAYGPVDFVLPDDSQWVPGTPEAPEPEQPGAVPPAVQPETAPVLVPDAEAAQDQPDPEPVPLPAADEAGPFEIADVMARIDAFWRNREEGEGMTPRPRAQPQGFRFETDSRGVFRWVDGVSRSALVGRSLGAGEARSQASVDGVAAGAFRHRASFANARLHVDGASDAAGDWLMSGVPVFDPADGRFTGYRGTARRPRSDERAEPVRRPRAAADSLRQLVHELRTPTNAIAGFAEMIEAEMLGPVPPVYRERASTIRGQARELLGAIDDLDLAARIDSSALTLVPGRIVLGPVLAGIAQDLAQLAALRGAGIALPDRDAAVHCDRRALDRLLARLMATLVSAAGPGEVIGVRIASAGEQVVLVLDRPRALADHRGDAVLDLDDEWGDATLLGTGFALRLTRNLARELGGSLAIDDDRLTLRLPGSVTPSVGQAHLS